MALDPLTAAIDAGGKVLDFAGGLIKRLTHDKGAQDELLGKLQLMAANGELQQMANEFDLLKGQQEINKIEAASTSLFVSGWRPAIGWVCGAGFAMEFVIFPVVQWCVKVWAPQLPTLPSIDIGPLMTLAATMLGMGAMRMGEKFKGVASK